MTDYQETLLKTALELASKGYYVFPLTVGWDEEKNKKKLYFPFSKDDAWDKHSTRDEEQINEWFAVANKGMRGIGVDCGKSGIVNIDLDVSGDKEGVDVWRNLPQRSPTPMTVTTGSGGLHGYYRDPTGLLRNSSNEVGPGIDVRAAGGLVVAPPSRVWGTKNYYKFNGEILPVDELPTLGEALVDLIVERQSKHAVFKQDGTSAPKKYEVTIEQGERAVASRLEKLKSTRGGYRNTIFGYASAVAQFECAKANDDNARCDHNSVVTLVEHSITPALPSDWAGLDDEDMQWIEEGVTKGLAHPWLLVHEAPEEVLSTYSLDELLSHRRAPRLPGDPSKSHAIVAPIVVKGLEGRYLYVNGLGWHEWVGDRWSPEPATPVRNAVQQMIIQHRGSADRALESMKNNVDVKMMNEELEALRESRDDDLISKRESHLVERLSIIDEWRQGWEEYSRWWYALSNGYDFTQVIKFVEADPGRIFIKSSKLDLDPYLLNCTNGTVDLRTGEMRPHDPRDFITKSTGVEYDIDATHELWDKARLAFAPGIERWLQMRVGQGSIGLPSVEDDALFNFGRGANGKSTLADAIRNALGDYAVFLHDKALLSNEHDHGTEKMVFRGARWAVLEELPEAQILRSNVIKKLIGTSTIRARMMRQDTVEFESTHTIMVNANHKPQVLETDHGTWRRLVSIPWPYTFRLHEDDVKHENDRLADTRIKQAMTRDAKMQSACLRWIVEGAVSFYEQGHCGEVPQVVKDDTAQWRNDSNTFGQFFDEELEPSTEYAVSKVQVLKQYNNWLEARGKRSVSDAYIVTRMYDQCATVRDGRIRKTSKSPRIDVHWDGDIESTQVNCWVGLRWKEGGDTQDQHIAL